MLAARTLGVPVCGVRRDEVENPSESAARTDPEAGRDNEPEDAPQESTVVNLAQSRKEEREHGGYAWVRERTSMTGVGF